MVVEVLTYVLAANNAMKQIDHTGHYNTSHWMDTLTLFEQRHEKTCYFAYSKTKGQIS